MKPLILAALAAALAYHWRKQIACSLAGHLAPSRSVVLQESFCGRCLTPAEEYLEPSYGVHPDGVSFLERRHYDRKTGRSKRVAV